MLLLLTLIVTSFAADNNAIGEQQLTGKALADYVRTHQNLFQVEESEKNDERMKYLMPASFMTTPSDVDRIKVEAEDEEPPERFDAREQWPYCKDIIGTVRDQSHCGFLRQ
ncbi:hypothetical protein ANCDUO_01548 [Ancylostoma duodenale]|uniref:Uncharacterized protein n=1 Tax=Ancylostoma duodenale TaxID=51022 RepID=A0A0C2H2V2_9BILA|nr:hypothetical protein ANCDUO_01548 [Ancylostoma duodenale]